MSAPDAVSSSSPTFRTIELTQDPLDAPRSLNLAHAICLPCRSAGSRCEGHDKATVACIQCVKRGDRCLWRLVRERKRKRRSSAASALEESSEDPDNNDHQSDDSARDSKRAKKERSASVASHRGERGKPPVPSAGWPSKRDLGQSYVRKPRNIKQEDDDSQATLGKKDEDTTALNHRNEDSSSNNGEEVREEEEEATAIQHKLGAFPLKVSDGAGKPVPEGELFGQLINHFESVDKGRDFLYLGDHTSLLASLTAQATADLAKSLHWWKEAGPLMKAAHLHPATSTDEDWHGLPYLAQLLAENVHTWDLWPRLPAYTAESRLSGEIAARGPAVDTEPNMPEEIAGIALRQLADSSLFENLDESLTPLHVEALLANHAKQGVPYRRSRKNRKMIVQDDPSIYAAPQISEQEFRNAYLKKEDLILDHIDHVRVPLIQGTLGTLDEVLLFLAESRKVQPARRARPAAPPPEEPAEEMSEVKKGKQRAADQDAAVDLPAEMQEPKKVKYKKKERQPPSDWKAIVLAAASVPGMPRG